VFANYKNIFIPFTNYQNLIDYFFSVPIYGVLYSFSLLHLLPQILLGIQGYAVQKFRLILWINYPVCRVINWKYLKDVFGIAKI
jgi:hypothetical protein